MKLVAFEDATLLYDDLEMLHHILFEFTDKCSILRLSKTKDVLQAEPAAISFIKCLCLKLYYTYVA